MGSGEKEMRTWGYVAGGFCVGLGILSLVLAVLTFVLAKSEVTPEFKDNTVGYGAVVLVISVVAIILGGVTIWKMYLTNELYLKIKADVALGKVQISSPAQPTIKSVPPQQEQTPTNSFDFV